MLPARAVARLTAVPRQGPVASVALNGRRFHDKRRDPGTEAAHLAQGSRHVTDQTPAVIREIYARRARAGKLVAGVVAVSNSDMFKGDTAGMPNARNWDHLLSKESLSREPCSLKQAGKHLKNPNVISLGGGLPSSELFPFARLSMQVPAIPGFSEQETLELGETASIGKYDVRDNDATYDLSIGLNYGQATGSPQMLRFLTEHTEIVCRPPYADWGICQTIGSTGALEQALRMFCDKNRGDTVITDNFTFSTALETMEPLGIKVAGSPIDHEGLIPEAMDDILSNWDTEARGSKKPHVLYTIPSGQNPTGTTQGVQRRQAIYDVAKKHDLFILEDEPYYFLQMQPYTGRGQPAVPPPTGVEEYLSALIPSLVSIDVDGRVMRMDSFSKILVPGSRLGWITASAQIIERYQRHAEVASQGPSGFSQLLIHKLLDETWGHEGFFRWLMYLRAEYTKKRDALVAACEDHLPQDIVSWNPPEAGMFMWITIDSLKHPRAGSSSIKELEEEIFNSAIENETLVARGSWFVVEKDRPLPGLHFRAAFAATSADKMNEAVRRLGRAISHSFGRDVAQ